MGAAIAVKRTRMTMTKAVIAVLSRLSRNQAICHGERPVMAFGGPSVIGSTGVSSSDSTPPCNGTVIRSPNLLHAIQPGCAGHTRLAANGGWYACAAGQWSAGCETSSVADP